LNEHGKASFVAATAPHSGDRLLALPITACGHLDDESVCTAVAVRLGVILCEPLYATVTLRLTALEFTVLFASRIQTELPDTGTSMASLPDFSYQQAFQ